MSFRSRTTWLWVVVVVLIGTVLVAPLLHRGDSVGTAQATCAQLQTDSSPCPGITASLEVPRSTVRTGGDMHGVKLLVRNRTLGTITFTTSQPSIALFLAGRSHAVAGGYQGSVAGTTVQLSVGPGGTTSIPVVATALRWQNGATTAVESQKDLPPGNYALIAYLHLDRLKNGASSQIAAPGVPVKVVAH